jgi:hypothetical protein
VSEAETNSAGTTCEKLLEFVYGELDDAGKRAFEEHLPGCPRCQAEVASLGRARTAARRVMPSVEPPPSLTGALHAQLMLAAAQRKPKRGVVIELFKRVAQHPQLAAAAMFVVVGGTVAYQWQRGKLAMPSEAAAPVTAAKPEPEAETLEKAASPSVAAAHEPAPPAATTTLALDKKPEPMADSDGKKSANRENEPARGLGALGLTGKEGSGGPSFAGKAKGDDEGSLTKEKAKVVLQTPSGAYDVARASPAHASATTERPKPMKKAAKDVFVDGTLDGLGEVTSTMSGGGGVGAGRVAATPPAAAPSPVAPPAVAADRPAGKTRAASGGASSAGALAGVEGNAKSSAPITRAIADEEDATPRAHSRRETAPPPPPAQPQQWTNRPPPSAPARNVDQVQATQAHAELANAPAPSTAPAAPADSLRTTVRDDSYYRRQVQAPQQQQAAPSVDELRKRADEAARNGRCDEAIRLFEQLERMSQRVSPQERVQYVRCLATAGRQDQAEQQLLELKADKSTSSQQLSQLQDELEARKRLSEKRAKRAAPAEQQAVEVPVQAAPRPAASRPSKKRSSTVDTQAK